ncbi:PIN domain-containing protein [Geoalkalibacter halelectricus]|uniref:PIN domain-containing protein n=1 Tax=Geoalkalibacter halelectricus TaxID=2847045 RepID=UPI003D243103
MSPQVFVDTDVILDLLSRRAPFYPAAARLFSLAERGEVKIHVSSLCFANLFYILRKELTAPGAIRILKKLRQLVTVLPVDDTTVSQALESEFRDFEDALQYHAAIAAALPCLVTRNGRDYPNPSIRILTAEEFLAHSSTG